MIGILGTQALVLRGLYRRGTPLAMAAAGAFASLAPALLLTGGVLWLVTDYPHFLALHARSRLRVPDGPVSCTARGYCEGRTSGRKSS
jgi:hypothetical protein